MPTYQYKCKKCGKEFEYLQSMSEATLTEWPLDEPNNCNCNAGVVRKVSMGGGVILKGTGFYETDYVKKSGSSGSTSSSVNSESSKSESKADAKVESKSENNSSNKSNSNSNSNSESKTSSKASEVA